MFYKQSEKVKVKKVGANTALYVSDQKGIHVLIGIGRSLTAPPSHTTVHTGPYTAIRLIKAGSNPGEHKTERFKVGIR